MLLSTFRMPQNKAIHCYLLMSLWIILIIIIIYKFSEPKRKILESDAGPTQQFSSLAVDVKTKRILKICNFPDDIEQGDEGKNMYKYMVFY